MNCFQVLLSNFISRRYTKGDGEGGGGGGGDDDDEDMEAGGEVDVGGDGGEGGAAGGEDGLGEDGGEDEDGEVIPQRVLNMRRRTKHDDEMDDVGDLDGRGLHSSTF